MRKLAILVIAMVLASALPLAAQKNELAATVGGYFPASTQFDILPAGIVEGSYARRIVGVPLVGVYAELPVAKTFNVGFESQIGNFSALFVAPGVKLKLAPEFFISPWVAVGGGVAHFSVNGTILSTSLKESTNTNVFDIGGGVDMKVAPFLSFRMEARDYNSGGFASLLPQPVAFLVGRQQNVIATAGIVVRF